MIQKYTFILFISNFSLLFLRLYRRQKNTKINTLKKTIGFVMSKVRKSAKFDGENVPELEENK